FAVARWTSVEKSDWLQRAIERRFFHRRQLASVALAERTEPQRTDGNANQPQDFDATGLQHSADLAVFAFVQNDFDPLIFFAAAKDASCLCPERVAIGSDAACEVFEQRFAGKPSDLYVVGFVEMRFGRSDPRGPFGIVGEEQQPFAGFIKTPDGPHPRQSGRQ